MKKMLRKALAAMAVFALMTGMFSGALAMEYPSFEFQLPLVLPRPTPTPVPTAVPSPVPTAAPTAVPLPGESLKPTPAPTAAPTPVPTATPAPTVTPAPTLPPRITYQRDAAGALVLDAKGNPIVLAVPAGVARPAAFMRNADGALVLDAYGDPIPVAAPKATATPAPQEKLNEKRSVRIGLAWANGVAGIGETVTMSATLTGYENTVYTLQWQSSKDNAHWSDLPGATGSQFTTTVTPENAFDYWRIQVTVNEII